MEIKYPILIVISLVLFVASFFISGWKGKERKNKNKVANTVLVRNTEEFKSILRRYRMILYVLYACIFICVMGNGVLSSRIIEEQTTSNDVYNRDIILCMDVSGSVIEVNEEIIKTYKEIVSELNGERFGVSIFNTTSVLVVPLTDDYDYILDVLDTMHKAFKLANGKYTSVPYSEWEYYINFIQSGTIIGAETRGSSFAGDGLAACVFDFPNLEEKRSRIIILSTDNDVYGPGNVPDTGQAKQYVTVTEAAQISKKKGITVYTIAPSTTSGSDAAELKNATVSTGGEYYVHEKGPTVKNIVQNIESKEKSLIKGTERTTITDYPKVPFFLMLIGFLLLIVLERVVMR